MEDDSPNNETTYPAEFWVSADALTTGGSFTHFVAYSGSSEQQWVVINDNKQAVFEVHDGVGEYNASVPINLNPGWQQISV